MNNCHIAYRKIPFSPPDISEAEISEVSEALDSGWITTGPRVKQLEKNLAEWLGVPSEAPNCVCLNSQTACAELSLRLLGIGSQEGGSANDEVIVCAYTYTASASIVEHIGAKLVLIDCGAESSSIEMDYQQLEAAINENTKAVIPVDLGGIPCDYDTIFEIVKRKSALFRPCNPLQATIGRVAVVEDAAHALGATYHGQKIGTVADFTNFSFHAVKNFTTAEGGALVWTSKDNVSDAELYHKIQLYSLHGQSKDALSKTKAGAWEYDVLGPWYKCNMTDIMGAIGLKQLERYPGMLVRRKEIIGRYDAAFRPLGVETLTHYNNVYTSSGHLYITRVPGANRETANEIIVRMAERGVSCNVHYKPLPMLTAYRNLGFDIRNYPNAHRKFENEITLPLHTRLSDDDVQYLIETYRDVLKDCL